jgi:hypothetical protein
MKKLWFKQDPAVTAEVLKELNGQVVVQVTNPRLPETPEYLGFIAPEDWSDIELVPVPLCVAPRVFIAILGEKDPESVTYEVFDNEVALRVAMQTRGDILGFFELAMPSSMIPA